MVFINLQLMSISAHMSKYIKPKKLSKSNKLNVVMEVDTNPIQTVMLRLNQTYY